MAGVGLRVDAEDFRRLGRQLKEAGNGKEVRKGLYRSVSRATRPVRKEIKASALAILPASGGLNRYVASLTIRTKQQYTGTGAGVTIIGAKNSKERTVRDVTIGPLRAGQKRTRRVRKAGTFGKAADMRAANRGRIMHPRWGRGPLLGPQSVTPGFFDRPLEGPLVDRMRKEVGQVLDELLRKI